MQEFNSFDAISKQAGHLADRVEFVPNAKPEIFQEISVGIFFVMAFWSGPSRLAFHRLVEVVSQLDVKQILSVTNADTDSIPEFYESPTYEGMFHGWGETFWIRKGQVISNSGVGLNLDCFRPNTLELLRLTDIK